MMKMMKLRRLSNLTTWAFKIYRSLKCLRTSRRRPRHHSVRSTTPQIGTRALICSKIVCPQISISSSQFSNLDARPCRTRETPIWTLILTSRLKMTAPCSPNTSLTLKRRKWADLMNWWCVRLLIWNATPIWKLMMTCGARFSAKRRPTKSKRWSRRECIATQLQVTKFSQLQWTRSPISSRWSRRWSQLSQLQAEVWTKPTLEPQMKSWRSTTTARGKCELWKRSKRSTAGAIRTSKGSSMAASSALTQSTLARSRFSTLRPPWSSWLKTIQNAATQRKTSNSATKCRSKREISARQPTSDSKSSSILEMPVPSSIKIMKS